MYTPVLLDKTRNFKFGMRAVDYIEQKFGMPISKVDFNNLTIRQTATVILAGLIHEDKNLTEDMILDSIDKNENFEDVINAMQQAMKEMNGKKSKN